MSLLSSMYMCRCLKIHLGLSCPQLVLCRGRLFSCGIVLGWCWLTTRHPPKCLLTPTPQQDGTGRKRRWKRSSVETKTARSLTNHCHGQNRLNLGKSCLLSIKIDLNSEKPGQKAKYLPLHSHLSPRLSITPSFATLPPCLLLESSSFVFCNKITSSRVYSQARWYLRRTSLHQTPGLCCPPRHCCFLYYW